MVAGAAPRVDALGLQQCTDLVQRECRSRYARPLIVTCPEVGVSRPTIIRMVVDLPAPFGPRNPVTRPSGTTKVSPSTASLVPYPW